MMHGQSSALYFIISVTKYSGDYEFTKEPVSGNYSTIKLVFSYSQYTYVPVRWGAGAVA